MQETQGPWMCLILETHIKLHIYVGSDLGQKPTTYIHQYYTLYETGPQILFVDVWYGDDCTGP